MCIFRIFDYLNAFYGNPRLGHRGHGSRIKDRHHGLDHAEVLGHRVHDAGLEVVSQQYMHQDNEEHARALGKGRRCGAGYA